MKPLFIRKIEWERIDIGTAHDPDATMPGGGVVTVDETFVFCFSLSWKEDEAIQTILQAAAEREIKRRLEWHEK